MSGLTWRDYAAGARDTFGTREGLSQLGGEVGSSLLGIFRPRQAAQDFRTAREAGDVAGMIQAGGQGLAAGAGLTALTLATMGGAPLLAAPIGFSRIAAPALGRTGAVNVAQRVGTRLPVRTTGTGVSTPISGTAGQGASASAVARATQAARTRATQATQAARDRAAQAAATPAGQAFTEGASRTGALSRFMTTGSGTLGQRAAGFVGRRFAPASLTGLPLTATLGGGALYLRSRGSNEPAETAALAELLGAGAGSTGFTGTGGLTEQQMALMELSNQRQAEVIDRILNDPAYAENVQSMLDDARNIGAQYVEAKAPALRREFEQLGLDSSEQAEALRRLAAATSENIAAGGEAAASDIEGMLYGGEPVSEVSGLTPLSGAISDIPAAARESSGIAAEDALRALGSSAEARQFAADQATRYGAGYAGEMGDEMALQFMALERMAQQQMMQEQARRRSLADQFELEQASQLGQLQFAGGMDALAMQQEKEQFVQRAIASGKAEEYVREWNALSAERRALAEGSGVDFREYMYLRESGQISKPGS